MRILMLNDNRAHENWGAQATPHAIDGLIRTEIPEAEVRWLSWDWLRSQHRVLRPPLPRWSYDPAGLRLGRRMLARVSRIRHYFPRVADDFDHFADEWTAGRGGPMARRFLDELAWCDVLVYNGENSIYRNTLEGTRALFLLWLSRTRVGRPSLIVNHTAHLTGTLPLMNAMVRRVYPVLDAVTNREAASYRQLRGMGIDNAELVPDVVFWLEEDPSAARRTDTWIAGEGLRAGEYVCMSASGLPVSRPRGTYDGQYLRLVEKVQERTGLRAVLMARDLHCQFLGEVARRTGAAYFGPEHHFTDLWPLLRQAAALVTGHFHYGIIAASGGCPFVPLTANNHKMAGVCELLGWEPAAPFDVTDLAVCGEAVADTTRDMVEGRPALSSMLLERSAELRSRVRVIATRIRQAVEGGSE